MIQVGIAVIVKSIEISTSFRARISLLPFKGEDIHTPDRSIGFRPIPAICNPKYDGLSRDIGTVIKVTQLHET